MVLQAHCPKESSLDISKPHMVAHACIFANFCSKFFNVVNYDETGNYYLNLKDFTRETILTALAFLYTGIVKCSSKVLPDLRRLARHLGMEEMLIICNELLRKQKAIIAAEKREQKNLVDKVNISKLEIISIISMEACLVDEMVVNLLVKIIIYYLSSCKK